MSLKTRLLFSVVLLVSLSVLALAAYTTYVAVNTSTTALAASSEDKMRQQGVQTKQAIKNYLAFNESQIRNFSSSSLVFNAANDFVPAFNRYTEQRGELTSAQKNTLFDYYKNDFATLYKKRNDAVLSEPTRLVEGLTNTSQALQYDFIAASQFPIGEKDKLTTLSNNSDYAKSHARYHDEIRQFLQEFGYYDIFIVEPKSGEIVYSVYKELDFATDLKEGPYADTGIGNAFSAVIEKGDNNYVAISKLETYLPSYDAMAGFLASAITDGSGEITAVLIFQIPIDRIGAILTHNQEWKDSGFGDSGETYLVSPDGLLVTESRFFLEDRENYLKAISATSPSTAKKIKDAGTSVGLQRVDSAASGKALNGQKGFEMVKDYRDVSVFSSYLPLAIGEHTYGLLAEIDVSEALAPAQHLQSKLVYSTLIVAVVILVFAVVVSLLLAKKIIKPLEELGEACSALSSGDGNLTIRLNATRIPEINNVITPFNAFITQIQHIVEQIKNNSDKLLSSSDELAALVEQSKKGVAIQLGETEMVAASVEELSVSIAEVSRNTVETRDASTSAMASLKENMDRADLAAGNIKLLVKLIRDSQNVISTLQNEVGLINSLLSDITSIADQTNLLALNAAIEAARAGEAGRGFSVVADEVRALANRSQESTHKISSIVDRMNDASSLSVKEMEKASTAADGGIHLVDLVTTAMNELSHIISQVSAMAETVATATEEQNATSDSVSGNVNSIAEQAEELNTGIGLVAESATSLSTMAKESSKLVSGFTV
ncbi:methyl-accepting chemotaxis protein [Alteromonas sp. A079]|uniref:methyl-accepting chemotaxis protein n=1 Tax=Alteromonas sp. A079 TaxID=3410268 RepID=UPI003BA18E1D